MNNNLIGIYSSSSEYMRTNDKYTNLQERLLFAYHLFSICQINATGPLNSFTA